MQLENYPLIVIVGQGKGRRTALHSLFSVSVPDCRRLLQLDSLSQIQCCRLGASPSSSSGCRSDDGGKVRSGARMSHSSTAGVVEFSCDR